MSDDLIAFLRARLSEDEQVALSLQHEYGIYPDNPSPAAQTYLDRFGRDRALAEVEAKRRILEMCRFAGDCNACDEQHEGDMRPVLRLLALPYAGHPEFRQEWRPAV